MWLTKRLKFNISSVALLFDDAERLKLVDKEICRAMFESLLESKDGGIRESVLSRLRRLFQICGVEGKVKTNTVGLLQQLKKKAEQEEPEDNENARKVCSGSKRALWLIKQGLGTAKMKWMLSEGTGKVEIRKQWIDT